MEEKGAIEIKIDERGLRKKEEGASRASRRQDQILDSTCPRGRSHQVD
jgi:hypothetical protein